MQSTKDSQTGLSHRAQLLDGAVIAEQIKDEVAAEIRRLWADHEVRPGLAAVRVGDDAASAVYVRNKMRACEEVGIRSEHHALPGTTSGLELADLIESLNTRADVDGILVQLPLPNAIEDAGIIEAIDPSKDVDGFHPINIGKLSMGQPTFAPCTPAGIIELLDRSRILISGTNACVVGRSQIVGRPMAQLLLQRDATVTICHSRTRDLEAVTRQADLLIVAIGRPGFVGGEHIKPGATVIDVGM
ncbi:MAG TPA: bifunctional 5,10-methylenetetrahydrofolate dehydrogenase/5,10-methenyltetrahydrofolate cyclohydrolase, partial [Pyrinomonadaceae bacterium]|nr:bifunctional 5,10-methylenetetrahydrofolate dehydrogenase/5,10-methenyltetrahydrofolate cyclohydrolase [Pyrinomonadaceae bacterium]